MRLAEFLVQILEAHGQTLQRLAALLGEENLLALLEANDEEPGSQKFQWKPEWFSAPSPHSPSSPYAELEGTVRELHLPEFLEFHLWAYPFYRSLIECDLDLNSKLPGPGSEAGTHLVDEAVSVAETWVKKLGIPPGPIAQQVERAAHIPWLRFRTETLKRIGRRPLGPVY